MSDYGVQPDGSFRKKPVDVIREEVKNDFINEIGKDLSLRENSTETQIINAVSLEISRQWAAIEGSYYASFYEDAFGVQLDKQLAQVGFLRRPQRGATGEVTFSSNSVATQDVTIPEGTRVNAPETKTRPATPFKTTEDATLQQGNSEVTGVPIEALERWETSTAEEYLGAETNLSAGTITSIVNPIAGVDAVNNPVATGTGKDEFTEGRDEETDAEFKNRYQQSLGNNGKATRDAVRANLVNADADVVSVDVKEKYDKTNDEYGANITVLAPNVSDDVIAQAIFDSMALGLKSYGSDSGTAESESGENITENFNRATAVNVEVDVSVDTDDTFVSGSNEEIKDRLIRYIGGTATDGTLYPGVGINNNVIFDQVFRRVMNQTGVIEATVDIGEVGNTLAKTNISVGKGEAGVTTLSDITITEV